VFYLSVFPSLLLLKETGRFLLLICDIFNSSFNVKVMLKKAVFFWLPPVLWMGLMFFLSSFHKIQVTDVGWANFVTRKLAHLIEYAVLCFLFFRGFKNTTGLSLIKILLLAFFLTIIYSLTDEYHQTFISGRTGRSLDIFIDSLGAVFGLIFSRKIINLLPERIKKVIL